MIDQKLEDLLRKAGSRRVNVPLPKGRLSSLPEADEVLPADIGEVEAIPLGLFIVYVDSKGARSERRIACRRYEPASGTIFAWCFERQTVRRFKVQQIEDIVCAATGEVFDRAQLIEGLQASGLRSRDERLARLLTVLVFLMRCDREVHPLEVEVIEAAATAFALRFDGDDSVVEEGMRFARRLAPDGEDLVRSLRWLAARPERQVLARMLGPLAERIIVADGRITSDEAWFGGIVSDVIAEMVSP